MDIRALFQKQAEGQRPSRKRKATPIILDDDDDDNDFKPSTSASSARGEAKKAVKRGKDAGTKKRKSGRGRAKVESDSEDEAPPKKLKTSPQKVAKGTTPKKRVISSLSSFFGSAPIKRSSHFKGSPSKSEAKSHDRGGGSWNGNGDEVLTIPDSPTEVVAVEVDDEAVARATEEGNRTPVKSTPSSSQSTPIAHSKKLKLMMEKVQLPAMKSSPQKTKPTDETDDDFKPSKSTERIPSKSKSTPSKSKSTPSKSTPSKLTPSKLTPSKRLAASERSTRQSPRILSKTKKDLFSPEKEEQELVAMDSGNSSREKNQTGGQETHQPDSTAEASPKKPGLVKTGSRKVRSWAKKRIAYEGESDEETDSVSFVATPPKKMKPDPSPSKPIRTKSSNLPPVAPSTSPAKTMKDVPTPKTGKTSQTGMKQVVPTAATPKSSKPSETGLKPTKPVTPVAKTSKASSTSPSTSTTTPKVSRGASYQSYLSRGGPRAPGSKEIPVGAEDCLEGLTFVITGVLESLEREEASDLVKRYGGRVTGSVSKKTSYLVVGEDAGQSKIAKASSLGTTQIDEDGLLDLIRSRPSKGGKGHKAAPAGKKAARKTKPTPSPPPPPPPPPPQSAVPSKSQKAQLSSRPSPTTPTSSVATPIPGSEALMWVDKYRPKSIKNVIGQQGERSNAKKLLRWLQDWEKNHGGKGGGKGGAKKGSWGRSQEDGSAFKAALLSGPPGVGKTTTAALVCEEAGYTYVEMNASASRSKKTLQEEVAVHLGCLSIDAFKEGGGGVAYGRRHALIMDEVDGMAGNEDRGGVQELLSMIKTTHIPVICICNNRQHTKIRSLANYCFDLRFQKPRMEQIRGAMLSICYREGIKASPQAIAEVIMASGQDVRQVLHNLSVWTASSKSLSFDEAKESAWSAKKEMKLNPFDVVKKVFMPREGERMLNLAERSQLFFHDYSIGPLFVQENYPRVKPQLAKDNLLHTLRMLSLTADSLCLGDLVEKKIRTSSQWGLLPVQAIYSTVLPSMHMCGFLGRPEFPQWLGNNSKRGKCDRMLQELQLHTRLGTSCNKTEFGMDYVPFLRSRLTQPLVSQGAEGVPTVISTLNAYDLTREDWDSIVELDHYAGRPEIPSLIPSKVKAAFTRLYNKDSHLAPYGATTMTKKLKPRLSSTTDAEEEEGEQEYSSEEETGSMSRDPMVKAKRPKEEAGKKGVGKRQPSSNGKGKGKGKGNSGGRGKGVK